MDFRFWIFVFSFLISDFGILQISDFGVQISDFSFQISDFGFHEISDFGFRILDLGSQTNFEFNILYSFQISDSDFQNIGY